MAKEKGAPAGGYTVIRDTREQAGKGWQFPKRDRCLGTVVQTMPTGDYTLVGWENRLTLERKGSVSEYATNAFDDRFWRELERMTAFEHAYLLLEFHLDDIERFPKGTAIPYSQQRYMKVRGPLLLKRFHEMRLAFPLLRVEFVGGVGQAYCSSLFKRLVDGGQP